MKKSFVVVMYLIFSVQATTPRDHITVVNLIICNFRLSKTTIAHYGFIILRTPIHQIVRVGVRKNTILFIYAENKAPHPYLVLEEKGGEHPFLWSPTSVIGFDVTKLRTNRVPGFTVDAPGKMESVLVIVLSSGIRKQVNRIGFAGYLFNEAIATALKKTNKIADKITLFPHAINLVSILLIS